MFNFFKKNKKSKFSLALYIGFQEVQGLVFENGNNLIKLKALQTEKRDSGPLLNDKKLPLLVNRIYKSFNSFLSGRVPTIISLGRGRVKAKVRRQVLKRDKRQKEISQAQARLLKKETQDAIWTSIKRKEVNPYSVKKQLVKKEVDGHPVDQLEGCLGEKVALTWLNVYLSISDFNYLNNLLSKTPLESEEITLPALNLSQCLSDNVIVVHLSDQTSQISVKRKGFLELMQFLSLGCQHLKNKEESLLWRRGIFKALERTTLLPSLIKISGDSSSVEKALDLLKKEEWPEGLPFTDKPQLSQLSLDDFSQRIEDETRQLDKPDYIGLVSLSFSS